MLRSVRTRLDAWLPAALLLLGSALFLGAGRLHPHITNAPGPGGRADFFRHFAEVIVGAPGWESMHTMILLGPVLWALAASGVSRLLPANVTALGEVGRGSLLMAAGLWAVAFVLDGFVAPLHARTVLAAGVDADATALHGFQASQLTMARLGMMSVLLIGVSAISFSAALLAGARALSWRWVVAASGLVVGGWLAFATASGEFSPGPFTSPYWMRTALAIGLWFLLLGTVLPGLRRVVTEKVSGTVGLTPSPEGRLRS